MQQQRHREGQQQQQQQQQQPQRNFSKLEQEQRQACQANKNLHQPFFSIFAKTNLIHHLISRQLANFFPFLFSATCLCFELYRRLGIPNFSIPNDELKRLSCGLVWRLGVCPCKACTSNEM